MADSIAAAPACSRELFHGLPCWRLSLPGGDSALVAEHGAHVLSWVSAGRERLFLSDRSQFNGRDAIRGGVPVCWPQFNARGDLPKHGFARNLPWAAELPPALGEQAVNLTLRLCSNPATLALWPQAFEATLAVSLTPGSLCVTLSVHNMGVAPLQFTGALHTYLAVDDVSQAMLSGLQGQREWDALADQHHTATDPLAFAGAVDTGFDRVYSAAPTPLTLQDGEHALTLTQSPAWANTVVWTPSEQAACGIADMAPQSHRRMLCVEAAQVDQPVAVAAGTHWTGWQRLNVA